MKTSKKISSSQYYIEKNFTTPGTHTLKINSTSTNLLFVNGTKVTGATPSNPYEINVTLAANESATYQIITQNGDKAPHIEVVKLTCNAN